MRKQTRQVGGVLAAGAALGALAATGAVGGAATRVSAAITPPPSSSCRMANGIQHVIQITFDNVHYNRDNPNVLSDLEQMPALQNFITGNGTLLSNDHTPLIAHTADDSITNYTGLYGDRAGQPLTNDYETYGNNNSVTEESSFAYWTGTYGLDSYPNQPYSATVPAAGSPPQTPPAPWVPFTRAGCDFGAVSTANMVLENTNPDLQNVFGSGPEVNQLNADKDPFKDQETNDYVGLGVHCAQGDSFCASAQTTKYGQNSPSNTQAPDLLPDEPGGYANYTTLFGHKYLQPQLAQAATTSTGTGGFRDVNGNSYQVTDAAGNLVDLNGTELDGQYVHTPGFPGFGPISPAQSLAYVADMQETGVPVTYAYISDVHEVKSYDTGPCSPASTYKGKPDVGYPDGPGDPCYYQTTAAYNDAFQKFFQRLADDGINKSNTLFIFTADEGDHFAGANAGRAVAPACSGMPDTTSYTCSYASGQIGEQEVAPHGLLTAQESQTTSFYNEPQGNAVFVTGPQRTDDTAVRQLERDLGTATANDYFDGNVPETIANYEADPTVEQLLHFTNADPNRTPTFTMFPKPDFYLDSGSSDFPTCAGNPTTAANAAAVCSSTYGRYAWNHGYYAPEINNTWLGMVGPGVANKGVDGFTAGQGPSSAGDANSQPQLDTSVANPGTWADHTDLRPTLMALTGLKDDYVEDGRVLTQDLTIDPGQTKTGAFGPISTCYKQLNSSVGQFGTDVLEADTAALKTGTAGNDLTYTQVSAQIQQLGAARDALASRIKGDLYNAEFNDQRIPNPGGDLSACIGILHAADQLSQAAAG